ncbi:MAG: LuxR C-terminal-related transcriptional regulator [Solirubrobacteraceae bacterium]
MRARLLHLSGVIEARGGSLRESHRLLLAAADAANDPSFRLTVLSEAAEAASYAGDFAELGRLGERAARIPAASERDRFNFDVFAGFIALYRRDHDEARARFADALRRADGLEDPIASIWAANAAAAAGGWGAGLPYATRAVELARDRGLLSVLPRALERQGGELVWNSKFDHALAAAEEGYRLSSDMGFPSPWNLVTMAFVEAIRGREDAARAHTEQVLATGEETGGLYLMSRARFTLAFIDLVAGRWEHATDRLLPVTSPGSSAFHPITARAAIPELVEAAVRAGREEEIGDALTSFRDWVLATESAAGAALVARCQALLGSRPGDDAFAEAIADEAALPPFQQARTRLLYGEWLRRERRRTDARVHLREALDVFRALGADPWEERAAAELRATGETARKRDASTLDDLTPQELQIAGLVTDGLTNREIAGQLYLSPRTIEYHLRKVFSKLGITSRTELVRQGLPRRESG